MQKITIPFSIILGLGRRGSPGGKIENVKLKLTKPGVFTLPNLGGCFVPKPLKGSNLPKPDLTSIL